jgi:predicted Zn-dependent protease with MMP-like domain
MEEHSGIDDATFHAWVQEGIEALPLWVKEDLTNVAFLVHDELSEAVRREYDLGEEDMLFGLYEGVPRSLRGEESPLMPDTITLFKKPILDTYTDTAHIRECIANTIWHEVAHYYGHDEEWVEEEEVRRGKLR